MQPDLGVEGTIQPVITTDQIQRRLIDIARQINTDYHGGTLHAICVLEDGFMFFADLMRQLEMPVTCQFLKPEAKDVRRNEVETKEIYFSPEVEVKGADVLLVMALLGSGITTEFLVRNLAARGASSVKVATLLDRQGGRRVMLQPDYFGFLVDESYLFGYGMGSHEMGRNLPYVATVKEEAARTTAK